MVRADEIAGGSAAGFGSIAKRLAKAEYVAAFAIFAALFGLCFALKMAHADQLRGDSAMYFQGVENVAHGGPLASQVQASIVDYLNINQYEDLTPGQLAADPQPLFGRPAAAKERSLLLGHAYFILYPIAQLVRVFPVKAVLLALYALAFAGVILLVYYLLRRRGVPIAAAAAFCLFVTVQPTWSEGLLWGQFYPDRLFLLLGLILMGIASAEIRDEKRTAARAWLAVAAVACASINERGAIVAGLFLLMFGALYWKRPGTDRFFKLGLGAALLVYGLVTVKLLTPSDAAYGSFLPTNWRALVYVTHLPTFVPLVRLFLIVNAPLLVLAIFEWRAAVMAAVMMLPNIFGNIGGSEKDGWSTHYPTFYFTPLLWAALTGYAVLWRKCAAAKRSYAPFAVLAVTGVFLMLLNPYSTQISIGAGNFAKSPWTQLTQQIQTYVLQTRARTALAQAVDGVRGAVPEGAVVSSVESGMPILSHGRTIEFFPADIDHADYAVLGAWNDAGTIEYNGAVFFGTPDERKTLQAMVLARMRRDGYDLAHPQLFPAMGLAVVRRLPHS